jgi:glycosyltransferase involved in cell wall biosynthesis
VETGAQRADERPSGRRTIACLAEAPGNPYLRLLYRHLAEQGFELVPDSSLSLRRLWRQRGAGTYLHFHWPEPFTRFERGPRWGRPALSWAKTLVFAGRLAAARALGFRLVWTIHQVDPHESVSRRRERAASIALARAAHVLVAHDASTAGRAAAILRRPAARVHVVPHGSYVGAYPSGRGREAMRAELAIPPSSFAFLSFGELRPYKRIDLLLDAFASAELGNACLVIAGRPKDASLAAAVRARAAADPRVKPLLEHVPDERVSDLFAACDAVVLARDDGGTSGSLVLALSMGRPVVAAASPAYAELTLGGEAGWLFDPDGDGSLRKALEEAAADPGAAARRADAALAAADRLRWPEIAAQLASLLAEAAPSPARAADRRSGLAVTGRGARS